MVRKSPKTLASCGIIGSSKGKRKKQIQGSTPKKLVVIHNTPATVQTGSSTTFSRCSDKVKLVYVGILQDYRLIKEIIEAVSESDSMEIHIGGFGKYEDYIKEKAAECDNIHFYGRMSYADTLSLEKECDVMLAIYDPSIDNHFYAAPNKFYESLMLGKPVIMVKNTGMSKVVEDNDIGVLIEYSKEGFINGVERLVEQKTEWNSMGERMKLLYNDQYSWAEMGRRLVDLYVNLD